MASHRFLSGPVPAEHSSGNSSDIEAPALSGHGEPVSVHKAGSEHHGVVTLSMAKAPPQPSPAARDEWVRGDPGPFGLLCFGMTTCMLMFIVTRWSEASFLPTVFCYALFYGGFGQFCAGMLELIKGNTFGGTAFASYGCFWMGWWLLEYLTWTDKAMYPLAHTGKTLWAGLWGFLSLGFFVVTLRKNGCLQTIFSTLVITFALISAGVTNSNCAWASGYFGFFCGSSAIYAAFAMLYKLELGWVLPGMRATHYI